jgi:hypothetical protein
MIGRPVREPRTARGFFAGIAFGIEVPRLGILRFATDNVAWCYA